MLKALRNPAGPDRMARGSYLVPAMPWPPARLCSIALAPLAVACGGALLLASCTGNIGADAEPARAARRHRPGRGHGTGGGGRRLHRKRRRRGPSCPGVLQSGFARLTRAEYRATIKDAFGVDADVSGIPEDGRVGPFTSNVAFASDPVQPFLLASEDLAALIVPAGCPPAPRPRRAPASRRATRSPSSACFAAPSRRPSWRPGRRCSATSRRPA